MRIRFFITAFILFVFSDIAFCGDNSAPDPLYLSSPVQDYTQLQPKEEKNDPRAFEEKFRSFFHLPKSKKIYFHNIDKSNQPITTDDYYELAVEKKRRDFVIPEPVFEKSDSVFIPDSHYRVISYNTPPGQRNIDLSSIVSTRVTTAPGILSPDNSKMVFTQSYFYPKYSQTASSAFYIPISPKNRDDAYNALLFTNVIQKDFKPIVSVGSDFIQKNSFVTLFPIDWSMDSSKIAFKEQIGSNYAQTWQTNIIVYDFSSKKYKRLSAVREAIVYWWRVNKNIDLKDYMWDIFPVGWDKENPERIVVYAYAFTNDNPLFLGTWSIDFNNEKSQLLSVNSTEVEIDLNGFGLQKVDF